MKKKHEPKKRCTGPHTWGTFFKSEDGRAHRVCSKCGFSISTIANGVFGKGGVVKTGQGDAVYTRKK